MGLNRPRHAVESAMIRVNPRSEWALRSLDSVPLNTGFIRIVLDGQVEGRLWVDRLELPRVMHALHPYGMSLVWGDAVADAFDQVINHLRSGKYRAARDEWLQIDPRWESLDWDRRLASEETPASIGSAPCCRHERVNFSFDEGCFQRSAVGRSLPDGWRFRRAIADDFELPGQVVPKHFWHNTQQFLAAGGGWCAEQGGRVGAIAFVSYRWGNMFELGIETLAHARRKGLGRAAATFLIADVLQAGLKPVWSCRMDNAASYSLAQELGFQPQRANPYYYLRQQGDDLPRN